MTSSDELKALQREARALIKPLEALTKLKGTSASFVPDLEAALKKLPKTEALTGAADEVRQRAEGLLKAERAARLEQFGRVEAAYINRVREAKKSVRELNSSWRIGPLEIELKREQSRARVLYNREEVVGWKPVSTPEHLDDLEAKGRSQLEKLSIADEEIPGIVWSSFRRARAEGSRSDNADLVPAHDLLREMRLELVRRELKGSKAGRKLKTAEFPLWALLHNLDLYRSMLPRVPEDKRIGFQTGSQQEQAKGMGIVLNGLDAAQDYKVFCYTIPAR